MTRAETLDTAKHCVCADRNKEYGKPEDNFAAIAALWGNHLHTEITPRDVALMMTLFKIGRISTAKNYHPDSYVDACGYMACASEIAAEEAAAPEKEPESEMLLEKAVKHYGSAHQLLKCIEELEELSVEIMRDLTGRGDTEKITEEIADVYITIDQTQIIFGISDEAVEAMRKIKLKRLAERMAEDDAVC